MSRREVWQRQDGKWAWRLKADNGYIVATDGGQGYENEADCTTLADAVIAGVYKDAERVRIPKM